MPKRLGKKGEGNSGETAEALNRLARAEEHRAEAESGSKGRSSSKTNVWTIALLIFLAIGIIGFIVFPGPRIALGQAGIYFQDTIGRIGAATTAGLSNVGDILETGTIQPDRNVVIESKKGVTIDYFGIESNQKPGQEISIVGEVTVLEVPKGQDFEMEISCEMIDPIQLFLSEKTSSKEILGKEIEVVTGVEVPKIEGKVILSTGDESPIIVIPEEDIENLPRTYHVRCVFPETVTVGLDRFFDDKTKAIQTFATLNVKSATETLSTLNIYSSGRVPEQSELENFKDLRTSEGVCTARYKTGEQRDFLGCIIGSKSEGGAMEASLDILTRQPITPASTGVENIPQSGLKFPLTYRLKNNLWEAGGIKEMNAVTMRTPEGITFDRDSCKDFNVEGRIARLKPEVIEEINKCITTEEKCRFSNVDDISLSCGINFLNYQLDPLIGFPIQAQAEYDFAIARVEQVIFVP